VTLLFLITCAALNRWRGTGNRWSLVLKRIVVSAVLCAPLAYTVGGWLTGAVFLLLLIPGYSMGWGAYFDMSDAPNRPQVAYIDWLTRNLSGVKRDLVAMSIRGLHFTLPQAALVALFVSPGAWVLAPLGALMGPAYYFAHRHGSGIAHAELIWGAALGAIYLDLAGYC